MWRDQARELALADAGLIGMSYLLRRPPSTLRAGAPFGSTFEVDAGALSHVWLAEIVAVEGRSSRDTEGVAAVRCGRFRSSPYERRIDMVKQIALATLLLGVMGSPPAPWFAQGSAQVQAPCLHGPSEQATQRTRREQAVKVAQQINRAEQNGPALLPSQPRREYRPLAQLPNISPTPAGFRLQFYTDGATYTFSLKDTLDRCEFAIFSDQDQGIYQATPRTGVQIVPAEIP
jgi:hypothetical protein